MKGMLHARGQVGICCAHEYGMAMGTVRATDESPVLSRARIRIANLVRGWRRARGSGTGGGIRTGTGRQRRSFTRRGSCKGTGTGTGMGI